MGPMGSSSGTGPLEVPGKTSTLFHSCSPIPFVRIAAGAGPNCGQQEVCGARHTRHSSLHTRIWYPLRSGMALESVGFFSPDGLQAKRLRTINKLCSQSEEPAHREASTGEASRKASDLSCTIEGRIILQHSVTLPAVSTGRKHRSGRIVSPHKYPRPFSRKQSNLWNLTGL